MGLADFYTKSIHNEFRVIYAAWPLGQPIKAGDVGVLVGGSIFIRQSNLDNEGLRFGTVTSPHKDDYTYKSTSVSEVSIGASASAGPAGASSNARLEVSFGSANGIYFTAADGSWVTIDDLHGLAAAVMDRYSKGQWDISSVVVTSVFEAGATTVVTSKSNHSQFVLEASSPQVKAIDLKDASINVTTKSTRDLGLQVVANSGMTPLLGLAGIKKRFFGTPHWTPDMSLTLTRVTRPTQGRGPKFEEVYFGSLGSDDIQATPLLIPIEQE